MSDLTPLGILLLSMLIMAFLQLVPGLFLLFSHYKYGQLSKKRASDLGIFFILGVETSSVLFSLLTYIILNASLSLSLFFDTALFNWILAGIILASGILFFIIYYRKGTGSELFVSRNFALNCRQKAKSIKTRSEAFLLGLFAPTPELIFTLPLYIITNLTTITLVNSAPERAFLIILFALASIVPLLIYHLFFSAGVNLANFLRFRFKNKTFFRFFIPSLYLLIALLIVLGVAL